MTRIALTLYQAAWRLARPLLRRNPRLREGWGERTLQGLAAQPVDLWLHCASGGEAMLATLLFAQLDKGLPTGERLRVLATAATPEGRETLARQAGSLPPSLAVEIRFFPLDEPSLMTRAFAAFRPRLAVVLETELWPGFLWAAREAGVPVLLVNGRMSPGSLAGYRRFAPFFRRFGPQRVLAVSDEHRQRFAALLGPGKVGLMANIKFDRLAMDTGRDKQPEIDALLPPHQPLLILGSIRRQEEPVIFEVLAALLKRRPDLRIGLFPKHGSRLPRWAARLNRAGMDWRFRSAMNGGVEPGTVILWDRFGELAPAYHRATAAFVGGSLAPLGGHNVLEPLAAGLTPVIGPHWEDFAWLGEEIIDCGLVHQVNDGRELFSRLEGLLNADLDRHAVRTRMRDYCADRGGGSRTAAAEILRLLGS